MSGAARGVEGVEEAVEGGPVSEGGRTGGGREAGGGEGTAIQ